MEHSIWFSLCVLSKALLSENETENRRSNKAEIDPKTYLHGQNPIIRLIFFFWQNEHHLNHVVMIVVVATISYIQTI